MRSTVNNKVARNLVIKSQHKSCNSDQFDKVKESDVNFQIKIIKVSDFLASIGKALELEIFDGICKSMDQIKRSMCTFEFTKTPRTTKELRHLINAHQKSMMMNVSSPNPID